MNSPQSQEAPPSNEDHTPEVLMNVYTTRCNRCECGRTGSEALTSSLLSLHTDESGELLSKLVPLISAMMQLPRSATVHLNILPTINGLRRPREPALSPPTRSRINIPAAFRTDWLRMSVFAFLSSPLSLLHLLSFVFRTSRCRGNHFRQPNQKHLHIPSQRKVWPLRGSFRFMRTGPDRCPHWPCQGSKHASVIRANSYWMALH